MNSIFEAYNAVRSDEQVQLLLELNWKNAAAGALIGAAALTSPLAVGTADAGPAVHHQATVGQKNNNPINLKAFQQWDGMTGKDSQGHAIFQDLEHGIRAGLKNLKNHFRKNPDETLVHYMNTFAEKNGTNEAEFIAKELGISKEAQLKTLNPVDVLVSLSKIESRTHLDKSEVERVRSKYGL
jgi:hypothetical protein